MSMSWLQTENGRLLNTRFITGIGVDEEQEEADGKSRNTFKVVAVAEILGRPLKVVLGSYGDRISADIHFHKIETNLGVIRR